MMIFKHNLLRAGLGSLMLAFLLSCGGGSEVGGGSVSGSITGTGVNVDGSSGSAGSDGSSTSSAAAGGGDASSGNAAAGGGDSSSGGSDGGSTSTAGNGTGDGSGVGSGGTGATSANASTAVGSVDGMGSIIVGGIRYDVDKTDPTQVDRRDTVDWQLGVTVAVTGPVDAATATGTALKLKSTAQMRGAVDSVNTTAGTFQLLGSTVSVDDETVWADVTGLADLTAGPQVQVWALPVAPGVLRATRVETQALAGTTTLVTGMIGGLDSANSTFQLGSLVIDYKLVTALPADGLSNGRIVRVEAAQAPVGGVLRATAIEGWYALSTVRDARVQLEGVIADFASKSSFKLMGVSIDGSSAPVTGGQENKLNNGVKVVAVGVLSDSGVLVASSIKIRHVPGGGALTTFYDLHGTIENYAPPFSSMRVRTASGVQQIDITNATISAAGTLANGQKVRVQGTTITKGVLQVTDLTYE
ncbi:MAG: hypothetical protein JSS14_03465 [Proteobacteria bacterium]|nr:hypothetical protein [Pseudomonadota bacterium]